MVGEKVKTEMSVFVDGEKAVSARKEYLDAKVVDDKVVSACQKCLTLEMARKKRARTFYEYHDAREAYAKLEADSARKECLDAKVVDDKVVSACQKCLTLEMARKKRTRTFHEYHDAREAYAKLEAELSKERKDPAWKSTYKEVTGALGEYPKLAAATEKMPNAEKNVQMALPAQTLQSRLKRKRTNAASHGEPKARASSPDSQPAF